MNNKMPPVQQLGRYIVQSRIASGGMADIYLAKLVGVEGFEKQVAIKQILPHWSSNREFVDMLIDEAKVLLRLNHANIVQVFELNKQDEIYFLVMEFVDGIDLRFLQKNNADRKENIPLSVSIYIVSQLLQALQYAHSRMDAQHQSLGIVHRDISPQNILLNRDGEVKVTDFGIAKIVGKTNETVTGTLKGKFAYMSPEQALGRDIDHRTDIFAVGIVFYEMITGQRCFKGKNDLETLEAVRAAQIDFPNNLFLPDAVKTIIQKSLCKDLEGRYQSAEEMLVDLRQCQKDFPAEAADLKKLIAPYITLRDAEWGLAQKVRSRTKILKPSDLESLSAKALTVLATRDEAPTQMHPETVLEDAVQDDSFSVQVVSQKQLNKWSPPSFRFLLAGGVFLILLFMFLPVFHQKKNPQVKSETKHVQPLPQPVVPPEPHPVLVEQPVPTLPQVSENVSVPKPVPETLPAVMEPKKEQAEMKTDENTSGTGHVIVNVVPWGKVSIIKSNGGVAAAQEAPLKRDIAAGQYTVRVNYPPMDKTLSTSLYMTKGALIKCSARFGEKTSLSCH